MRKIWDFPGGVQLPENKRQSMGEPLGILDLPPELVLPLHQPAGAASLPLVRPGQQVRKGQLLAEAPRNFSSGGAQADIGGGHVSTRVHAPTSGTITAIEDRPVTHPSGLAAPCLILHPDGEDRWTELQPCEDPDSLDRADLVERVHRAGLAGLGGAGFPTAAKLDSPHTHRVDTLILNGAECEPYITADDRLMRDCAAEVVQGALLLARMVGQPREILVGMEDNKPEAIAAMRAAAAGTPVDIVVFPTKYPSGGEKQLIQVLTGREVPSGQLPVQIGIAVVNVATACAAWRAVRYGEPLIERITTVAGGSLARQRNVRVRLGTPVEFILRQHGFDATACARVIIGGPMMGYSIEDLRAPAVITTNCVLAPSRAEMPPAPPTEACIRCGLCAQACPASLLPQQLYWFARTEDLERARQHNLFDCIECGACSYVCPSAIPLVQYYRAAKTTILRQEAEKEKSDRARARFERRKERYQRAEEEKEAKRLARKKAAEEAKARLEELKPAAAPVANRVAPAPAPLQPAPVVAAVTPEDMEQQGRKFARQLESAEGRVQQLHQLLGECEDAPRAEKLRAQLKQAELKLEEVRRKREDFARGLSTPLDQRLQKISEKVQASPLDAQRSAVITLEKRLAVAVEKMREAEREQKPTLGAMAQGVKKLEAKLAEAKADLLRLEQEAPVPATAAQDAATAAIARAQAKAAAAVAMTPAQKQAEQLQSLRGRVEKARAKFAEAEANGSEHLPALRAGLEKLENKLRELEAHSPESDSAEQMLETRLQGTQPEP